MELWYTLITHLPFEWAQYQFMQHALLAILLLSPLLAFLGCMVVNNQMAFFSDAIGHAGLTGIALGALLGLTNPLWAMILFALFLSLCITLLRTMSSSSYDTLISIAMSFAVALGIVILSHEGGFNKYSRFLIGDVLSITVTEIKTLLLISFLFFGIWILLFNRILLVSLNRSIARSRNIPLWSIQILFAMITALIVTVSIQWIGILVINALLVLPAATSRNVSGSVCSYVWSAVFVSIVSGISGLICSYYSSTATGATIVLFATLIFFISLLLRQVRRNQ